VTPARSAAFTGCITASVLLGFQREVTRTSHWLAHGEP